MTTLLLVEDDDRIRLALSMALEEEGHAVTAVPTAEQGLAAHAAAPADAVLVDLMLPGMDGFDCIRELRKFSDVPIIVVSARDDTHDVVAALEVGADDYVIKPVKVKELSARLRALRRRATASTRPSGTAGAVAGPAIFDDLSVDVGAAEVRVGGTEIRLTRTEFRLLAELAAHPGQVLSRTQLLDSVWGYDFGDERLVDVHIGRLRRKVEIDPNDPRHVLTVRGLGYKFR